MFSVMMFFVYLFNCLLALKAAQAVATTANISSFARFSHVGRSQPDIKHSLVFVIQQNDTDRMEQSLIERSTPGSALYQQWLTFEEIGKLTSNPSGAGFVLDWLVQNNLSIGWISARKEYIRVEASIARWEDLLGATFFRFTEKNVGKRTHSNQLIHRTAEYSLPPHIQPHVYSVLNTNQEPVQIHRSAARQPSPARSHSPSQNTVDIALLRNHYNIGTCQAHSSSDSSSARLQQAVVETADQRFSFEDISLFQQMHHLPVRAPLDPYGYNTTQCRRTSLPPNNPFITNNNTYYHTNTATTNSLMKALATPDYPCNEGNLNLQYLMAVAPCVETLFLYVAGDDPFVDWIINFADLVDPPKVFTVPWYSVEQTRSSDIVELFNREALKLSLMGVTIIAAAGSSGAANDASYCDAASGPVEAPGKGYFPSFPATSPYVTAVGATMGPESGNPEIACQSQLGGVITTGGGFSTYFPTPSWQIDTVSAYFSSLTPAQVPSAGYNPNGRGYPDVSLLGTSYTTIVNGEEVIQYGTESASAVFAGMVSLVNVERARNNQSSVGFLNPTLYQYGNNRNTTWYSSVYRSVKRVVTGFALFGYDSDVTVGSNKCMALSYGSSTTTLTCCTSGFYATEGWDPVTGWGSVQYPALLEMFTTTTAIPASALTSGAIAAIVVGSVVFVLLAWLSVVGLQIRYETYIANRPSVQVGDEVLSDAALSSHSDNLPDEML